MRYQDFRFGRLGWLFVLLCSAILAGCTPHTFTGTSVEPVTPAPDFTLTDQNGQPFQLSAQRGNVVVMFFGFTHCPDVCPTTLADLAAVRRNLGSDAERLKVVFITVDPERDTSEAIAPYVKTFDPAFIGLTGSSAPLEKVYTDYGVSHMKRELPDSALGYTVDHSAYTYVIDKAGNYRLLFGYDTPVKDLTSDLQYLIRES